MRCPYCGKANCANLESAVWIDGGAKVLGLGRKIMEIRAQGATIRETVSHAIGGTDAGRINDTFTDTGPRRCPYCRKTRLTDKGGSTLYLDLVVRTLGMARGFLRVRGGGFRALATAVVDGDDAAARYAAKASTVDVTPEKVEDVGAAETKHDKWSHIGTKRG